MQEGRQVLNDHDPLMTDITTVLEVPPQVAVPQDFSARLMARLPQQPHKRYRIPDGMPARAQYGRITTLASVGLLLMAMLLVGLLTQPSLARTLMQTTLFVQFCAVLLWMALGWRKV
jgi:hypothetical protein